MHEKNRRASKHVISLPNPMADEVEAAAARRHISTTAFIRDLLNLGSIIRASTKRGGQLIQQQNGEEAEIIILD